MLRMVGILKCEDETSDDVRKLTLADDWDKRTFMLTGDGLSQVRARTLDEINPLAFVDIITTAWAKLKKLDLVKTRFAAKEREKREQEISEEIYDSVKGNVDGADTDTTMEALRRLGINE